MATEESHRLRAHRAINAARRGHLPKPRTNSIIASTDNNVFETARENSIEVYDDKFGRNSILTRSARMRKFKFYQYKPIQETPTGTTPKTTVNKDVHNNNDWVGGSRESQTNSPQCPAPAVLLPRDDVLQGKVAIVAEQSKELSELDNQISLLEKQIAELNSKADGVDNLDEIYDLVNKKNDLLRRQMQLNIIEQEKVLEKANEELTKELRLLLSIEDSRKTRAELERQRYLYNQSLALVEKRNELVHHMDFQERGIEDDNALKETLKNVIYRTSNRNRSIGQDQNCCIQ